MKHKIILDTDPGIDDAVMISTALNEPNLDVALITTVAGNVTVDKTTKNALTLVDFFNKNVPVAAGASEPLLKKFEDAARIHGESGMAGYDFPAPTSRPLAKSAVQALRDTIMASEEPITLIPTGAYTNIALLLREYPEVKPKIKEIIAMGGTLGRGNMTSAAEFNVFTDPHAAAIVYNSGIPLVMVGLDVTLTGRITDETTAKVAKLGRAGKMLSAILGHDFDHDETGTAVHDLQTIFYLLHPEAFQTKDLWVDVVLSGPAIGETVADIRGAYHNGKTNVKVCVDIDTKAFNEWFLTEVSDNMQ
ncbi:ribonucleoside hydrolase RihC [Ligilactobacillus faecis]|uniref:Ribonucleoside hydrolase RihC n=1 Tax=Ligilactobacillus faecis TaxID=762833 RepID=A0ABV4DP81_9LACO|nr:ribonucleoside hydrolase RihC [Ligilactobacillus faecis]WGN89871.1 ribonucleoside hydrolase RihC [Ligilactobacillus faecis]